MIYLPKHAMVGIFVFVFAAMEGNWMTLMPMESVNGRDVWEHLDLGY